MPVAAVPVKVKAVLPQIVWSPDIVPGVTSFTFTVTQLLFKEQVTPLMVAVATLR